MTPQELRSSRRYALTVWWLTWAVGILNVRAAYDTGAPIFIALGVFQLYGLARLHRTLCVIEALLRQPAP